MTYWVVPRPRPPATSSKAVPHVSSSSLLNSAENCFVFLGLSTRRSSGFQFPRRLHHLLHRRSVRLAITAVDVAHRAAAVDDQRGWMRDVDRIMSEPVVEPVRLGGRAVFIQQKGK